jgi:hypothetical protein
MAQSDKEWFAVIGAIIVKWGAIEKMVATSIHQIETEVAIAKGITPVYTDLRSFRDFKARKGYLRKLFEQHAQKDELAMLDTIYQALTDPGRVRHALGHDIVAIQAMAAARMLLPPASGRFQTRSGDAACPRRLVFAKTRLSCLTVSRLFGQDQS